MMVLDRGGDDPGEAVGVLSGEKVTRPLQLDESGSGDLRGRSFTDGNGEEWITVPPHDSAWYADVTERGAHRSVETGQVAEAHLEDASRRRDALWILQDRPVVSEAESVTARDRSEPHHRETEAPKQESGEQVSDHW